MHKDKGNSGKKFYPAILGYIDQTPTPELSTEELLSISDEVDENLETGFPRLFFTKNLEAIFERETGKTRSRYLVLAGLVAIITHAFFLLTDYTMLPDVFPLAMVLRLGFITPLAFLIMVSIDRGLSPLVRELIESTAIILTSLEIIFLAVISKSQYAIQYSDGLIVILVFGSVVLRLRFWFASATSLITIALYLIFFPHPLDHYDQLLELEAQLILGSTVIFILFANYTLERDQRRTYLIGLRERIAHIHLSKTNQLLDQLSHTDDLTGIPNRRSLDEYLEQRLLDAPLTPISFMMIDIDYFKQYNDLYGHPRGDACLRKVAMILQDGLRQGSDMIARIGGEEFVIVLRGVNLYDAVQVANRLRQSVFQAAIPHGDSPVGDVVTISIGLSSVSTMRNPDALLRAADEALYRAKQAGRNQIKY